MILKMIFYVSCVFSALSNFGHSAQDIETGDASPFRIIEAYTADPNDVSDPQIINRRLDITLEEHAFLTEGIASISEIYESNGIPEGNYDFRPRKWLRNLAIMGQISIFAACEISKCLSIYYSADKSFGDILIGLNLGKAAIWTLNAHFNRRDAEISRGILLNLSVSCPSGIESDLDKSAKSILELADVVIEQVKLREELVREDSLMLKRLENLKSEMSSSKWFKFIGIYGGRVLTALSELTSGVLIHVFGQSSSQGYWSTLTSTTLGSLFDNVEKYFNKKPVAQKYMLTAETLYLCKYFSEKLLEEGKSTV